MLRRARRPPRVFEAADGTFLHDGQRRYQLASGRAAARQQASKQAASVRVQLACLAAADNSSSSSSRVRDDDDDVGVM